MNNDFVYINSGSLEYLHMLYQAYSFTHHVPCSAQRVSSPAHAGPELTKGAAVCGKRIGPFQPI